MPSYIAPVEDMMFLFNKLRNNEKYNEIEKYKEVNSELVKDILEEAAKISQNLILPLAKSGDESPPVLENGVVRTSPGYKEAYSKFIEDGWISLSCDPKYGGQGMPKTVSTFFDEMLSSTSLAFKLYSELTIGAYNCILRHASEEIKDTYLPKMVEGKWSGTMCLTEPVCGTDLGLLKTKAEEQSDGTYKISGQKIFITSGDHDLTENIIHLVLARATDSPKGTKGISLFLVPKFIVKEDGNVGSRNGVSTGSIENKMGIKSVPVAETVYDSVKLSNDRLLGGKPGLGFKHSMMTLDLARPGVAAQAVGTAAGALELAVTYAGRRKQFGQPISGFQMIQGMLADMAQQTEAARWLTYACAATADAGNGNVTKIAAMAKCFATDTAVKVATDAVQVFGGYGFMEDYPIAKYYRDAKILQIYEGTNQVQRIVIARNLIKESSQHDYYNEVIPEEKQEAYGGPEVTANV